MKKLSFVLLFICFVSISNAQDFRININAGMPLYRSELTRLNYNVDFLLNTRVWDKFLLGIGSSYLEVDLSQSINRFTFDKRAITLFGSCIYEIDLYKKIKLLPQVRAGYSFVESKLNEFKDDKQRNGGLYISGELSASFYLSKRFDLLAGYSYSTIFTELEPSHRDMIIPAIYIDFSEKRINQSLFKLGLIYHFNKRI